MATPAPCRWVLLVEKSVRKMAHLSILSKEDSLEQTALSSTEFGCPLCPRFRTRSKGVIQRHLKNHAENSVHFQEKMICRCNLSCRDKGHFHCPFCAATIIQKVNMIVHLTECQKKLDVVQHTSKPSSPETHPALRDVEEDCNASPSPPPSTSNYSPPSESTVILDHSYCRTASPKTPTDFGLPSSHVKCPHCSMVLYSQNLLLHIQRKHGPPKDITAQYHLKGTCVDLNNGLYAVKKTGRGFSVPVHVQRRTQGQQHVTECEMQECQQHHSMCHHIRSLDYCSTTATEEPLKHEVLQEMVDNLVLSASKVNLCKKKQQEAEEAHVPLSVVVDLDGSRSHICLSIFEPHLCHYSTLGRVMVTYNLKRKTWYCPCAKTRTSCPHKNIAKWHLFQTHKIIFMDPLGAWELNPLAAAPLSSGCPNMEQHSDLNIVLLGHTGVGKSASGNTILGQTAFKSELAFTGVTKEISKQTAVVFGKRISVVDTPGILGSEDEIKSWCQGLLQTSVPCLFLVVVKIDRFSDEQQRAIEAAERVIKDQEFNSYLLFSRGDSLGDKSLDDFINADPEGPLGPVVQRFGGRQHVFNNDDGGPEQVQELLEKSGHLREVPSPV